MLRILSKTFLCLSLGVVPAAQAGLFDNVNSIGNMGAKLFKSATESEDKNSKPLPPDAFDFATAASDPAKLLPKELEIDTTGKGIKGIKKVAIASLQLRIRKDLVTEIRTATERSNASSSSSNHVQDEPELYQKLTDEFYDRLVKDLAKLGIEVVNIDVLAAQDAYKRGRANPKPNGRVVNFSTAVGVGHRDSSKSSDRSGKTIFNAFSDNVTGIPYYVFYASKTPELLYPSGMSWDGTGELHTAEERLVEPGRISPALIEAAQKAGVGLLTLGFEMRYGKFDRSASSASFVDYKFTPNTLSTRGKGTAGQLESTTTTYVSHARVDFSPMLRTQLLALKITPEGATSPTMSAPRSMRASDGITVTPSSSRSVTCNQLLCSDKDYRWIETVGEDAGGLFEITQLNQTKSDSETAIKVNPAGFNAAFWQAMDAQRQLVMEAIKQAR
jgi:hypothetical protein